MSRLSIEEYKKFTNLPLVTRYELFPDFLVGMSTKIVEAKLSRMNTCITQVRHDRIYTRTPSKLKIHMKADPRSNFNTLCSTIVTRDSIRIVSDVCNVTCKRCLHFIAERAKQRQTELETGLAQYLNVLFDWNLTFKPIPVIPALSDQYFVVSSTLKNKTVLFALVRDTNMVIDGSTLKQLRFLSHMHNLAVVFVSNWMSARTRELFLRDKMPFVVIGNQCYLTPIVSN